MEKIRVRPRTKDLIVHDFHGRLIRYKDKGVKVNNDVITRRLLKCGDLVDLDAAKKKPLKKAFLLLELSLTIPGQQLGRPKYRTRYF
jgi:hypothetical protein